MTSIHAGLVALLCGTACVDADDDASDASTPSDHAHAFALSGLGPGDDNDVCGLLPACGPCAVACDLAALSSFVPAGTCAAIVCDLTDGRQVTFHACNPE